MKPGIALTGAAKSPENNANKAEKREKKWRITFISYATSADM